MSDAAPLIIILVIVGGIVAWGFMTDWTFSGLLPREGARCTPDEDSKDENAKEYVYDEDKECLVVNKCKEGWEPNYSNTACISELTGVPCDGSDPNGVYKFDTSGVCVLDSCDTGWQKSGTECISTLSGSTGDECSVTNPVDHGVYKLDTNGVCVLDSCDTGWQKSGGVCVSACDSTTYVYDPIQDDKCLNAENEIVDCSPDVGPSDFKDITFKRGCGAKDVAYPDIDGICHEDLGIVEGRCNETPGCIGYRRLGNGCARLIINTVEPIYEYTAYEVGANRPNNDIIIKTEVTLDQCKKHCDFNDSCAGISYSPTFKKCYLKHVGVWNQTPVGGTLYTFYKKGSEISTGS